MGQLISSSPVDDFIQEARRLEDDFIGIYYILDDTKNNIRKNASTPRRNSIEIKVDFELETRDGKPYYLGIQTHTPNFINEIITDLEKLNNVILTNKFSFQEIFIDWKFCEGAFIKINKIIYTNSVTMHINKENFDTSKSFYNTHQLNVKDEWGRENASFQLGINGMKYFKRLVKSIHELDKRHIEIFKDNVDKTINASFLISPSTAIDNFILRSCLRCVKHLGSIAEKSELLYRGVAVNLDEDSECDSGIRKLEYNIHVHSGTEITDDVVYDEENVIPVEADEENLVLVEADEENLVPVEADEENLVPVEADEENLVPVEADEENLVLVEADEENLVPVEADEEVEIKIHKDYFECKNDFLMEMEKIYILYKECGGLNKTVCRKTETTTSKTVSIKEYKIYLRLKTYRFRKEIPNCVNDFVYREKQYLEISIPKSFECADMNLNDFSTAVIINRFHYDFGEYEWVLQLVKKKFDGKQAEIETVNTKFHLQRDGTTYSNSAFVLRILEKMISSIKKYPTELENNGFVWCKNYERTGNVLEKQTPINFTNEIESTLLHKNIKYVEELCTLTNKIKEKEDCERKNNAVEKYVPKEKLDKTIMQHNESSNIKTLMNVKNSSKNVFDSSSKLNDNNVSNPLQTACSESIKEEKTNDIDEENITENKTNVSSLQTNDDINVNKNLLQHSVSVQETKKQIENKYITSVSLDSVKSKNKLLDPYVIICKNNFNTQLDKMKILYEKCGGGNRPKDVPVLEKCMKTQTFTEYSLYMRYNTSRARFGRSFSSTGYEYTFTERQHLEISAPTCIDHILNFQDYNMAIIINRYYSDYGEYEWILRLAKVKYDGLVDNKNETLNTKFNVHRDSSSYINGTNVMKYIEKLIKFSILNDSKYQGFVWKKNNVKSGYILEKCIRLDLSESENVKMVRNNINYVRCVSKIVENIIYGCSPRFNKFETDSEEDKNGSLKKFKQLNNKTEVSGEHDSEVDTNDWSDEDSAANLSCSGIKQLKELCSEIVNTFPKDGVSVKGSFNKKNQITGDIKTKGNVYVYVSKKYSKNYYGVNKEK